VTRDELLAALRADPAGAKVVDTRRVFIEAAGPYLSPSLAGVPGELLDELRADGVLEACRGPMGLPAYRLRPRWLLAELRKKAGK
jgi:hypothetical protein